MSEQNASYLNRRDFIRRAACAAVGTVGMSTAIRDLSLMNAAVAQSNINDYKALVCIFLAGGNDSNNLIMPTAPSEWTSYSNARGAVLAIPLSGYAYNILPVNGSNGGHTFGLHPACPELVSLFSNGNLAFLFNTGTLVYPMNVTQYKSGVIEAPPQLFSHADQVTQWQTSIPDQPPLTGWGGRCADLLRSSNGNSAAISLCVTMAGANTFETGTTVSWYSVSTSGAISLSLPGSGNTYTNRLKTMTNIFGLPYTNLQSQTYAALADHSINSSGVLNSAIAPTASDSRFSSFTTSITTPTSGTKFTSTLMPQLKMIARLIEAGNRSTANGGFGMKRQIFFCSVGGYDLHTGQTGGSGPANAVIGSHANLFAELSQSMNAFQQTMVNIGLANSVAAFTSSDFSRTFQGNGQGSDHGWGSHHMIMSAAPTFKGGQTYGTWPTLTVNGPDDTGLGRWLPTTATDQYFATLASWFGVDSGNLSTVFPNLSRFNNQNLGFI